MKRQCFQYRYFKCILVQFLLALLNIMQCKSNYCQRKKNERDKNYSVSCVAKPILMQLETFQDARPCLLSDIIPSGYLSLEISLKIIVLSGKGVTDIFRIKTLNRSNFWLKVKWSYNKQHRWFAYENNGFNAKKAASIRLQRRPLWKTYIHQNSSQVV